jgi:hypothetical protein
MNETTLTPPGDGPVEKGPAYFELEARGLNQRREDIMEDTRRAAGKKGWCASYRDDPHYPDARDRGLSATFTLATYALPLADMVERIRPCVERNAKILEGNAEGGKQTARKRQKKVEKLHKDIEEHALTMLKAGTPRRGLAGRLTTRFSLSKRQINTILKAAGV